MRSWEDFDIGISSLICFIFLHCVHTPCAFKCFLKLPACGDGKWHWLHLREFRKLKVIIELNTTQPGGVEHSQFLRFLYFYLKAWSSVCTWGFDLAFGAVLLLISFQYQVATWEGEGTTTFSKMLSFRIIHWYKIKCLNFALIKQEKPSSGSPTVLPKLRLGNLTTINPVPHPVMFWLANFPLHHQRHTMQKCGKGLVQTKSWYLGMCSVHCVNCAECEMCA